MKTQAFLLSASLIVTACVQTPALKGDGYALLESNYPIVNINGENINPSHQLDINPGLSSAIIVYNTYTKDYFCRFEWNALPGTVYEVTDRGHKTPLTMYRWEATNRFWAKWLEPVEPTQCTAKDIK
jgi:hypothetical protein